MNTINSIAVLVAFCTGAALGSERCRTCHPKQAGGYAKTGMANSVGRPVGQPGGSFRDPNSSTRIAILTGESGMRHRLEKSGLRAEYEIDYFIGSGAKGRSFLTMVGGRLFQSPASYYTDRRAWDLSPGFHGDPEPDFDRPIGSDCLFCHSGRARPVPFTLNQYEAPPFEAEGITCERCHGPAEQHLAKPSAANIVNPAKLKPNLRDAVCDQCHLGGEARILNPGRQVSDYRPGEPLERVLTVYVSDPDPVGGGEQQKVVSHSEQLAASKCSQASGGRLWCGSCHDPHEKPADPVAWYRERCLRCHSPASLSSHRKPADDCAGCHMPSRPAYDGGHTPFTDHRILARARRATSTQSPPRSLRPWREPDGSVARRNLGLAYISTGERYQSAEHLNEGFRHLSAIQAEFSSDPAVLTSLGAVLQKKGAHVQAASLFARAARLEPRDARHQLNLAVALLSSGKISQAISAAESAISLDQSLRDAYLLLAEIYAESGDRQKRRQTLERYLTFMPQSIAVRRMLHPSAHR